MSIAVSTNGASQPTTDKATTKKIAEAETRLLSSLMGGTVEFVEDTRKKIRPDIFINEGRAALYKAILAANDATSGKDRSPVMVLQKAEQTVSGQDRTLADDLKDFRIDDDVVRQINAMKVTTESGREHAKYILDQYERRQISNAAVEIYDLANSSDPGYRPKAERAFAKATAHDALSKVHSNHDLIQRTRDAINGRQTMGFRNVMCGIYPLDRYSTGIMAGKYYLIAAPPHDAKTIVSKNLAMGALRESKDIHVLFFVYEEQENEAQLSYTSLLTGPDLPWVMGGKPPEDREPISFERFVELSQDRAIVEAVYKMRRDEGENVHFEEPTMKERSEMYNALKLQESMSYDIMVAPDSIETMRTVVRRTARNNPNKHIIAVLDHMHLYAAGEDVGREISHASTQIARSCADDGPAVTWIVLAQFNRTHGTSKLKGHVKWDSRPGEFLGMSALAETEALGRDPDFVIFFMQTWKYLNETERQARQTAAPDWVKLSWSIMKNRIQTNALEEGEVWLSRKNGIIRRMPQP